MTKFGNHWATDAMKIAETFRTTEWDALRRGLEADEADAWLKAACLLRKRLGGRYLKHARELLNRPYSGFAILAIDSAVIEALEQFRKGVPKTPKRKSADFFKDFLTRTRFKTNWGQSNISPADARLARALSFNCPTRSVRF